MSSQSSPIQIQTFNPRDHPPLAPTYSHISIAPLSATTNLISFAGQVAPSPSGLHSPLPFADQVRAALANVDKCLAAAGATRAHIVTNRQYVVGLGSLSEEDFKARAGIFLEWWGDERLPPPDVLVGVQSLARADLLYEIEVTCVVGRG